MNNITGETKSKLEKGKSMPIAIPAVLAVAGATLLTNALPAQAWELEMQNSNANSPAQLQYEINGKEVTCGNLYTEPGGADMTTFRFNQAQKKAKECQNQIVLDYQDRRLGLLYFVGTNTLLRSRFTTANPQAVINEKWTKGKDGRWTLKTNSNFNETEVKIFQRLNRQMKDSGVRRRTM
jgi:hypothetical protein